MKVILFCGGLGMRLREYSENIPKPMVPIGYRPILWHLMKYYAHYGHKDFVLCLGHRGDIIKKYFLNYEEYLTNDFTLSEGGQKLDLVNRDIQDWRIAFVDTGLQSNIGQRLMKARKYLGGDEYFLANYSDGLSDLPLPEYIEFFKKSGKIACFLGVRPNHSFHVVTLAENGLVGDIRDLSASKIRINGGYFIFRRELFDYLREGEELVHEPFQRLIEKGELIAYEYDGFWTAMDTFKDKQRLEDMYTSGKTPWEVWRDDGQGGRERA
jgi:glucose-1-phosphate cytidylyltransferase